MEKFSGTRGNRISLISCMLLLCSVWGTGWCAKIVYPWRSTTAIVKTNETFEVWFSADSGQNLNSVQLQSAWKTVTAVITATNTTTTWTYDSMSGNTCNRKYTVKVPTGTPADRYNLVLKTSTGDVTSAAAVKVVKGFKDNYYIMHISDSHMYQGTLADKLIVDERRDLLMKIANILDVEILVETGDLLYGANLTAQLDEYLNGPGSYLGPNDISGAAFFVPGDHDAPSNNYESNTSAANADYWNDIYGLQNKSFKYGNGRFMLMNNVWGASSQPGEAIAWLKGAGSGGNFFVTAGHCFDKMHKTIHTNTPLDLVLAGDLHNVRTFNPFELDGEPRDANGDFTIPDGSAPEVAYIAGAVGYHLEYNLFRVNNGNGTFTKPSGSTAVTLALAGGNEDTPSTWVPAVSLTYSGNNNGTLTANTATITNRYGFTIYGAHVRFVMPKGNTYTVTNGTITQAFDGTSYHIVDVSTDVSANSTKTVSVSSSGGPATTTVPWVTNLTLSAAGTSITNAGLAVGSVSSNYHSTVAAGKIYSQTPGGGVVTNRGSTVNLALSRGPAPSVTLTFTSIGTHDGYVDESSETSNVGGTNKPSYTDGSAIRVGDTGARRQRKGF
ncbi:MAG: PASTA domain-containing protein, partial [Pontiellaceae bacterium]|nr:PASTA domain-containing protein [Pontiellaceae bacterium]